MFRKVRLNQKLRCIALVGVLTIVASSSAFAQSPAGGVPPLAQPSPTQQAKPSPSLERCFLRNILRDQRAIWTSPFHIERGDANWLVPFGLSTAALLATDHRSASELAENGDNQSRLRISRYVSRGGSFYTTGGITAAFYFIGRVSGNARARETGLLGAESLINSGIVAQALKFATQRTRPREDAASGEFFNGGNAFPSGHSTSVWSLATVVAYEYGQHRPLIRFGAYGLATAVSVSRYTGRNHFLSDVLVGSAIGYGVGRYVYRTHHDTSLDTGDGETKPPATHSKLIPFTSPLFSQASRSYGLALAWNF
jgi:hypothetical protein